MDSVAADRREGRSGPSATQVLVIDDDAVDAQLLRRFLSQATRLVASTDHRLDLTSGLEALGAGSHHVLLLDLNLPGSSGLDTLDRVIEADAGVPVIVLTGLSDSTLGQAALAKGAADYLCKDDLDARLLEKSIVYALERHAHARLEEQRRDELMTALLRQQLEISQALHDGVIQLQRVAETKLLDLQQQLQSEGHPCSTLASESMHLLSQSRNDLKAAVKNVPPATLKELGLAGALTQLARQVHREGRLTCRCRPESGVDIVNPHASLQLYYIAQQALNNALEHAAATEIVMSLQRGRRFVVLEVADNGRGFDPSELVGERSGWGLKSMRNRARAIGGRLMVRTAPRRGTVVTCSVAERRLSA